MPMPASEHSSKGQWRDSVAYRMSLFVFFVYLFLVGIKLFGGSVDLAGEGFASSLMSGFTNPFAGLAIGIFATAIMQSSSATTSLIVGMVGMGQIEIAQAIPVIMGANIGSTITCSMIALTHVGDKKVFSRVFSSANVHDMYNCLIVLVLFPTELITRQLFGTGLMEASATFLTGFVSSGGAAGASFNPINAVVEPVYDVILRFFVWLPICSGGWKALPGMIFSIGVILVSLIAITKNMQVIMADKMEVWLNRVLKKNAYIGLFIGLSLTMIVQSSAITTSLLIPMYAAGILAAPNAFPIIVGANIGTTITGLLASTVCVGSEAVTIALVHVLFNVYGMFMFFIVPVMRKVPVFLAVHYGHLVERSRLWAIGFIIMLFFVIPVVGMFIWKEPAKPSAVVVDGVKAAAVQVVPESGLSTQAKGE